MLLEIAEKVTSNIYQYTTILNLSIIINMFLFSYSIPYHLKKRVNFDVDLKLELNWKKNELITHQTD